jgi:uncharacterized membrane-anchored protein YitT (DUF2179 family)
VLRYIRDWIFIILGILSAILGLKGFLLPNHFIDGGVSGISMLLYYKFPFLLLPIMIILINAPFVFFGFKQVNISFGFKTCIAILGLAAGLYFVTFPVVTHDKLLAALFGGFFLGAGVGLSIRANCALDGTDIMALLISKNVSANIGEIIFLMNVIIFSVSAWAFGIELAMYSVLTYLAASKTADFFIRGIEEYTGMIIISSQSEVIRHAIVEELGRGVTIYKGKRGFTGEEQDILFCVITRLEIMKFKTLIRKHDENAFITMHSINDTTGGLIKKGSIH